MDFFRNYACVFLSFRHNHGSDFIAAFAKRTNVYTYTLRARTHPFKSKYRGSRDRLTITCARRRVRRLFCDYVITCAGRADRKYAGQSTRPGLFTRRYREIKGSLARRRYDVRLWGPSSGAWTRLE